MADTPDPFAPAALGPIKLRNRIIRAATFEGLTQDQSVSDRLVEFHRVASGGGIGMTTVAFMSVSPDGAATPNELVLRPELGAGLRKLSDAVHSEGAAASAQIGHAGAVAASAGIRGVAPSAVFSPLAMKRTRATTADDLRRIESDFVSGATLLKNSGFDCVEVHLGHGYLLSQFLSPKVNRRRDEWGGSVENRARFPRQVVRAVRDAVGQDIAVIAKLNMSDGVRGGLFPHESLEIARMLQEDGALDALELTGGSSLHNPMYLFRGEAPLAEAAATMPKAVGLGVRLFGRLFFKSYPFEEAYFLEQARKFRSALTIPLILLGGINRRETIYRAMAEGFEFVAMGRALLREPGLVAAMANSETDAGSCIHCNKCMMSIYGGTHCVLLPPEERPGALLQ